MEILSDATFRGNVSINGNLTTSDHFLVTPYGESVPIIETGVCGGVRSLHVMATGSIHGDFSVTRSGESSPSFVVGDKDITIDSGSGSEFQSTTIGGVFVNGNFSVTKAGESTPLIETNVEDGREYVNRTYALRVNGSEFVNGDLLVGEGLYVNHGGISLNSRIISSWSDLNNLLSFAKIKTFTSPSIPANCTAFEFTGNAISDSNKTHMIQVQNTSTGKSVIAETWMTTNKKPAMSFAGCTSTIATGTYTAMVV